MVASADQVIMLFDSSKFGVKSLTTVLHPGEVHMLITDSAAPQSMVQGLIEQGVDVHITP